MCKRVYLTAKEAEKEMQEARKADGFTGKMESPFRAYKGKKTTRSKRKTKVM